MQFPGRFQNRAAVITGGAAGIGLDVAARIVAEGGRVCLWDMNETTLAAASTLVGASHQEVLDIADPEQVARATEKTAVAMGKIDILIASAGITGPNTTLWEYPIDAWRRVLDVNLNGLFYCNRAIVPHMQRNGYGRIVNIASIAGKEGNPNASAYSSSKGGVIALTKSLGKELAKTEIRVNCVTPAAVRTPIFEQMSASHIEYMLSKIPIGRFGLLEEVTSLVCWLASEECSFSTGSIFDVSGGRATY
ncbi:MAG: SDR family NAD(P)-dependent oxidoreductase [Candidatus Korobacteraceae bacterium]